MLERPVTPILAPRDVILGAINHAYEQRTGQAQAMVEKALSSRKTDALHRRLVRYLARRFARRAAGRFIPLIGAPIGAIQNGNATAEVGKLALSYYARP